MGGTGIDSNSVPLKFEDIVDKKIYDKMRPPKPGGQYSLVHSKVEMNLGLSCGDCVQRETIIENTDDLLQPSPPDNYQSVDLLRLGGSTLEF